MTRKARPPKELLERVGGALRRIGELNALMREMIAGHFALPRTDRAGLDFLYSRGGACSAGELAKATGLTSGSTTALIDRLVKAGYATREPDPNDRRKQIVRVPRRVFAHCEAVYAPISAEMFKLWSSYSFEELELVEEFLRRSAQVGAECLKRLTEHRPGRPDNGPRAVAKRRKRA